MTTGLQAISTGLPSLKELYLLGCDTLTDQGFVHFGHLQSLEILSVWLCKNITDEGFSKKKIRHTDFSRVETFS